MDAADSASTGETDPRGHTRAEFGRGVRDALPVGVGLIPLGMAFGVLIVQQGFAWYWAPLFSILIYAGSMEFLAIGLFLAGTPLTSLAVTGLLVNFRHIFYGLSYPLHAIRSRLARAYAVYALTDETYPIVATKPRGSMSGPRALAVTITCQALWVLPGVVGALLGGFIPPWLHGFEFALTALFVVLAIDAIRANAAWWPPLLAAACGAVALAISPENMLVIGLSAYVVGLVVVFVWRGRRMADPGIQSAGNRLLTTEDGGAPPHA